MTDADGLKPGWLYSVNDIAKSDWQALFDNAHPFSSHAFLAELEQGGSVDGNSGWQSQHLAVWQGEQLVALVPGYLKTPSAARRIRSASAGKLQSCSLLCQLR